MRKVTLKVMCDNGTSLINVVPVASGEWVREVEIEIDDMLLARIALPEPRDWFFDGAFR